ncbi:MAG: hypothetical protein Ct9H300mP1_17860 [Planctomycetaceae bacterium]|nr:MAG: hypothetical protein Ct9H300mP1_17860 [Planctomycetaceae bacterium]
MVIQVKAAEAEKHRPNSVPTGGHRGRAQRDAAEREMQATKMLAEAKTADQAAEGLAEAQVTMAKADAWGKKGTPKRR